MSKEELAAELADVVAILTALGEVLPGRVDGELVAYLDRASKGGLEAELLHVALSSRGAGSQQQAARKSRFAG